MPFEANLRSRAILITFVYSVHPAVSGEALCEACELVEERLVRPVFQMNKLLPFLTPKIFIAI
ncbi:MAG: hypothetical protein Q8Q25_03490 [bacterium]|nr:hypothetical protein [bacterium]